MLGETRQGKLSGDKPSLRLNSIIPLSESTVYFGKGFGQHKKNKEK